MSPILDCYNEILTAFSFNVAEDGLISQLHPSGTINPIKIDGRRPVLPTKEWQRKGYGEDYIPFHPACEVMSREGTSPVLQTMQAHTKAIFAHYLVAMGSGLLSVAVDKDIHKDLPLECSAFLKKLSNADKTTKELYDKLIGAAVKKNRLLTVYLKNGGTYEGKKVSRSAIIRFPILDELLSDAKDPLGITIPKKQRPTLVALFQLIIPNGDKAEMYSHGTTTRVAPYLTALLTAFHKAATQFNVIIDTYAVKLNLPVKPIKLYDLTIIETLNKHYGDIPPYSGNEGSTQLQPEEAQEAIQASKRAVDERLVPKVTQTTRTTATVPTSTEIKAGLKPASMSDFMNAVNPQPVNNFSQPQPQLNTGFTPISFQPTQPAYSQPIQQGFSQPVNSFSPAPISMPSWMGGQPTHQQPPANPFMRATTAGVNMANGSFGLI